MPNVQRMGDKNNGGGEITQIPQSSVYIDNKLVCVSGSKGAGHPPCTDEPIHCTGNWQTTENNFGVYVNNRSINVTGDEDTCGHIRIGGSLTVFIG